MMGKLRGIITWTQEFNASLVDSERGPTWEPQTKANQIHTSKAKETSYLDGLKTHFQEVV